MKSNIPEEFFVSFSRVRALVFHSESVPAIFAEKRETDIRELP